MQHVPSKYTLVIVAAKRARQIVEGSRPQVGSVHDKPVSAALKEIVAEKLVWEPPATATAQPKAPDAT
ncbi:MAG: DNA-directed RNA polymerase subunit omega [Clostridia bacterium]|nr:DNA-directed RNA polymerase subunit omega [Clostridia bacterium]